ncbi:hypothetical protein EGW08_012883 [Elysia chlorotica]|uniref:MARVEL domain-containing protein n=1 Tax=Elysia chlorotica TaxID=188477 RepID=A0A3S0ZNZ7_ELYCH|nr:hypothetical protein EGW08_012883 [Elysia chlorotica]
MMRKSSTSPSPDPDESSEQQPEQETPPKRQQEAWVPMQSGKPSLALSRVALACAVIAFVHNTVGFSCPFWVVTEVDIPGLGTNKINIGLFRGCSTFGGCEGGSDGVKTWRLAAAGLEILGFIFTVLTLAGLGLFLLLSSRTWAKWLRILSAIFAALAGCLIVSAVTLFAINIDNVLEEMPGHKFDLSWSFAVAANASAFCIFTAILLVFDILF